MNYTLEQCLEQQKKVDAGIKHNGEYLPWLAGIKEVIEMCDHLSLIDTWKKQAEPDMKQAFMELVDVFAFVLSGFKCKPSKKIINDYIYFNEDEDIENLIYELITSIAVEDNKPVGVILVVCKEFFRRPITDIYYYYMGKQALTQFRQANGYKTGDYVKIWAGLEDNEHLTGMLEKGVSIADLPVALEQAYNSAVKHA